MQNLKKFVFIFSLFFLMLGLISAVAPANHRTIKSTIQIKDVKKATENGKLNPYVENVKGEKLTLKEKIGLKIFNKKIKTISKQNNRRGRQEEKSQTTTLLLAILPVLFLVFGLHRFYLGHIGVGVAQLLTFGACGVWWLIDLIRIIEGDLTPKNGDYDKKW